MSTTTEAPIHAEPAPFFSLKAEYLIAPGANTSDLLDDVGCLLDAGEHALLASMEDFTPGMWAGMYVIQQAHAVLNEACARLASERKGGAAS